MNPGYTKAVIELFGPEVLKALREGVRPELTLDQTNELLQLIVLDLASQ